MKRDVSGLSGTEFDVLVVGAGIYGAAIALDAAQRGLSVALIDRGDFGAATSFNSLKTIHGGVRSLLSGNLREMREFVRERRALSRIAPHLVHPLPFLIPTFRYSVRNSLALRLFLTAYDLGSWDRNDIGDPSKHLPPSRVVSFEEFERLYPEVNGSRVSGGAIWHDCQMYSSERVTFAFVQTACETGAVAANYVEAVSFLRRGGRIEGVRARDALGSAELDIRARLTINAAGPWAAPVVALLRGESPRRPGPLSKTMNFVIRRLTGEYAIGGVAGSRFLIMVPWRDCSIAGTSHEPYRGDPDDLTVTTADVERFLAELNVAFPFAKLTPADVRLVHCGLLPMVASKGPEVKLVKKSWVVDHRADGIEGLMSVQGVRFTTARSTAERAVDLAASVLGRRVAICRSAKSPLAGGDMPNFDEFLSDALSRRPGSLPEPALRRLVMCYGTRYVEVLRTLPGDPDGALPIGQSCGVTRCEVLRAIRDEMAVRLADVLLRRTEAGTAGHPGHEAVSHVATLMVAECGWDRARMAAEIAQFEKTYRIAPA